MFSHRFDDVTELRILVERDARELHELTQSNLEYLSEWLPWPDPSRKVEGTREFISEFARRHENDDGFFAGIWHKKRLAGVIS